MKMPKQMPKKHDLTKGHEGTSIEGVVKLQLVVSILDLLSAKND